MLENNNDSKSYNAADIQRYLNGQMSEADMHALESAALNDPFLADAIEGYEENTSRNLDRSADLIDLHDRLKKRIESKNENKIIPFYKKGWLKIAAMVLVMVGAGYLLLYTTFKEPASQEIVLIGGNKAPDLSSVKTDTLVNDNISKIDSTSVAIIDNNLKKPQLKSSEPNSSRYKMSKPEITRSSKSGMTKSRDVVSSSARTISPEVSLAPAMAPPPGRSRADSAAPVVKSEDRVASVTNDKARPVARSTVELKMAKKSEISKLSPDITDAQPIIGIQAYNRYIENSKKLFDSTSAHGEVIISFVVNEDGSITDYKIEKSLSRQADNEAVRLIKEGPPWKVLKNKRVVVNLPIKF